MTDPATAAVTTDTNADVVSGNRVDDAIPQADPPETPEDQAADAATETPPADG